MYPPSHLTLRGLTLYIDPHLLLVRVSKGLAHLEIELCSSISDLLHERDRGPSTEKIPLDSRPPHGEDPHQDLLTEKNRLPLYRPLLDLDIVSHLCVHRSSACVIYSCWLSDFSRVSLMFPLVFFVFLFGIRSFHERSAI